ncbi:hypothetical protein ACFQZI_08820 [Mucilaginibacter lutimaris]|uniref:DUF3300 domain-containing protein n=1 Tax=Mucilaginibacter lutimaris TaxID=931629 RepID=A0ABW2ZFI4_9SPHI
MKKSVILSAILFGSLVYNSAQAQISVHIGFNIPARRVYVPAPPPQPVMVYDNDEFDDSDEYYYLPEVEAYYSIPRHCYYYQDGGRWISAAYLPGAYRNYDWRTATRYEIRGRRPYFRHDEYRNRWGGNYDRKNWNWNRRDNNYAGRYNRPEVNRNNDWNRGNDWNKRNDRPQGGFNQPGRDRDNQGAWGRPQQPNRNDDNRGRDNQGSWGQPQQPNRNNDNQGGFGQRPQRNDRPQGGFNQPTRDRGNWGGNGGQQPQQPNRNDDNRGGGRGWDNGGNRGGDDRSQLAQNRGMFGSHRQARF